MPIFKQSLGTRVKHIAGRVLTSGVACDGKLTLHTDFLSTVIIFRISQIGLILAGHPKKIQSAQEFYE